MNEKTTPSRSLCSLSDLEARKLFTIAFGWDGFRELTSYCDEVIITGSSLAIRLTSYPVGFRAYKRSGHSHAANWPGIIDYLDALGVAIRGEV